MAQAFDLRIDGKEVVVKSARLTTTFDTANDGFTAQIECDRAEQPELYAAISPYKGSPAQVYLDGKLMLTGKQTKTEPTKSTEGVFYNIHGWSNTMNFVDSVLQPPYELKDLTLHSIAIIIGRQTNTRIVHTGPDGGRFDKVTVRPGQTGFQFLSPLAVQRQHVISSTTDGNLLLQQADISQKPVGTIDENDPNSLLQKVFSASYDLRERYRTYKVAGRRPKGNAEATATDPNINEPRHLLIQANDQVQGGLEEVAQYQLKLKVIEALKQRIPVVGWYAPNNTLWSPGTLITIISETLFVPNGWTYFIKAVDFELSQDGGRTAVLTLIPKEIYSEEPINEPWFTEDAKKIYLEPQNNRLAE